MRRVAFLLSIVCGALLRAHDPGLSSVRLQRSADTIVVHAAFANADFAAATAVDADRDGAIDGKELSAAADGLLSLLAADFVLHGRNGARRADRLSAALAVNNDVELTFVFDNAGALLGGRLEVSFLQRLSRGHRCYAAALTTNETVLVDALLTVSERDVPLPERWEGITADAGFGQGARFFALGVEHILIGFDHLAFLLALLVAGGGLRKALATITAFTAAHSLTLAAAALGVVRLPALSVEIAIAGSIVWVAIENLVRRGRGPRHRWPVAFAFGLVHGFGFANVLADLHVGGTNMLTPLLTFNLGVEVGQVAFAALVVPLVALVARRQRTLWVPTAISIAIGLAGLFWIWQRAVG